MGKKQKKAAPHERDAAEVAVVNLFMKELAFAKTRLYFAEANIATPNENVNVLSITILAKIAFNFSSRRMRLMNATM